jgi:DNA-binding GntR family transcriptional regulator
MSEMPAVGESQDQIARLTVGEAVAERLRRDIKHGSLSPGERLRQRDVATRLGVSTTPVREAFQLLQAEGLLTIGVHRGAIVSKASANELLEMYEIRELLECAALEHAIPNLTVQDFDRFSESDRAMEQSTDEHEWVELNMQFHMRIYEASARPRLCSMIEKLRDAMSPYLEDVYISGENRTQAVKEHREILKACREGDAKKARLALVNHLTTTRVRLTRLSDLSD